MEDLKTNDINISIDSIDPNTTIDRSGVPMYINGRDGKPGKDGKKGDKGHQGPRGYEGEEGCDGDKGDKGDKGVLGDKGDKGNYGDKGNHGDRGTDGRDGINGRDGIHGINGTPGEDGINGKHGNNGDKGTDGEDGKDGRDGRCGIDGMTGRSGIDGINGIDGLKGGQGSRGSLNYIGKKGMKRPKDDRCVRCAKRGDFWVSVENGDRYIFDGDIWINLDEIRNRERYNPKGNDTEFYISDKWRLSDNQKDGNLNVQFYLMTDQKWHSSMGFLRSFDYKDMNTVFLIDRSDHITPTEFSCFLKIIKQLINTIGISKSKIGIVTISDNAKDITNGYMKLETEDDLDDLKYIVNSITQQGLRNWSSGFDMVGRIYKNNCPSIIFLLTHGDPTSPSSNVYLNVNLAISASRKIKNIGSRVTCLGVGHDFDIINLKSISSESYGHSAELGEHNGGPVEFNTGLILDCEGDYEEDVKHYLDSICNIICVDKF
jgi:hypothetical protein